MDTSFHTFFSMGKSFTDSKDKTESACSPPKDSIFSGVKVNQKSKVAKRSVYLSPDEKKAYHNQKERERRRHLTHLNNSLRLLLYPERSESVINTLIAANCLMSCEIPEYKRPPVAFSQTKHRQRRKNNDLIKLSFRERKTKHCNAAKTQRIKLNERYEEARVLLNLSNTNKPEMKENASKREILERTVEFISKIKSRSENKNSSKVPIGRAEGIMSDDCQADSGPESEIIDIGTCNPERKQETPTYDITEIQFSRSQSLLPPVLADICEKKSELLPDVMLPTSSDNYPENDINFFELVFQSLTTVPSASLPLFPELEKQANI